MDSTNILSSAEPTARRYVPLIQPKSDFVGRLSERDRLILSGQVVQDERLSHEARRLLVQVLPHLDGWSVRLAVPDGALGALRECEATGYLVRRPGRSGTYDYCPGLRGAV